MTPTGNANEPFFAICLLENDEHIGNIKLGSINWLHRHADISLFIGDNKYWGQGLATEAINIVTEFSFEELNLNKVKAGCYAGNVGSAMAFEKCSFKQEGVLRNHCWSHGEYVDCLLYGLLRDEYQSLRQK